MRLASLFVYPVKSTRGLEVTQAEVEPWGLAGDRRFMVVDAAGRQVTAREEPRLLSVSAEVHAAPELTLQGPHATPLLVRPEPTTPTWVRIWDDWVPAVWLGAADGWFSSLLGRDVRLVWLPDPASRPVDPRYGRAGDTVSFADGYPLLVGATASLRQLNTWIAAAALERGDTDPEPLAMRRFRPNVVVQTDAPFVEDGWRRIRIGAVSFRSVKGCSRCVLTTIHPNSLVKGKEPIRTLSVHRKRDGKVWFGVNAIPDGTGTIRAGDMVEVLA